MNEYLLTLTIDDPASPPASIVLKQNDVDMLLNEYALPAAVAAAENTGQRTVTLGILEVSNNADPVWNGEKVDQDVFANMLGDALVLAAVKNAQRIIAEQDTPAQEPGADN